MRTTRGVSERIDHLCWRYDDPNDFRNRAREFLAEGLTLGQQVWYIADAESDQLVTDLLAVTGMATALRRGTARVTPLSEAYDGCDAIDPATQVAVFAAATTNAVNAGFSGLRVAADATALVRTPAQLDAFTRYEYLVDTYMARQPFTAMCGYNVAELGAHTVAQLACMHPSTNMVEPRFWLHATSRTDHCATLGGELDLAASELFLLALDRANPQPIGDKLVLDARGLEFIDHRSVLALAEHARERNATVVLYTNHPVPRRVVEVLNTNAVRVEVAA